METLKYGNEEIEYLKSRDEKLGKIIEKVGILHREIYPDVFETLVFSILGQQISSKMHVKLWERFHLEIGAVTPENVAKASPDAIRALGISMRKVNYIQTIANQVIKKEFLPDELFNLTDEEVSKRLLALKGVGDWTVEMIMIFSLGRPDVLSFKDFGIRRGIQLLYKYDEVTPEIFEKHRQIYSPYGTIAAFYLWEIANGKNELISIE